MNGWGYGFDLDEDDEASRWLAENDPELTTTATTGVRLSPPADAPTVTPTVTSPAEATEVETPDTQGIHTPVDNAPEHLDDERSGDIHTSDWQERAACKGATHKMFPREHKDITYLAEARAICAGCSVREECLEYALTFPAGDMHGVWAGLTPRQLAAIQKKRKIRPSVPTLAQMWQDLL